MTILEALKNTSTNDRVTREGLMFLTGKSDRAVRVEVK